MSKRFSKIIKDDDNNIPFNPYNAKRQSYHKNIPTMLIDDDPIVPEFPPQEKFTKNSHYNMKMVVVGDGGCGKTCLLVSYCQQKFPEIYVPTVFENYVTNVLTPNNKLIELALWDTAGQEEYERLRPLSYPDVDILIVCFALDNIISLQNVKDIWFPEVNHFCPGIPILLVGTKADLNSTIDPDLPMQLAYEINAIGYIQCSAKSMFNVKTVFNFAINHFYTRAQQDDKKRKSFLGHKHQSSTSSKKGHFKNSSLDSSILFDKPLTDEPEDNPYMSNYNNDEFAFTRRDKKKKRCVIL